jgi:hypothetical protein
VKLAALLALLLAPWLSSTANAAQSSAQLKVIVPRAAVRTGPAFSYREIYRAERGEVMPVIDRNSNYWFRVITPDGRYGWIYGEQVLPFTIDLEGKNAPSGWVRFKEAVFAPSPIPSSIVSFTFSGGALAGDGMFIFRPAVTLDAHFALEAHIGEAIGSDGSLLIYGLDGNVIIWPLGPLVPFLALGGGGGTAFPKINGVTQSSKTNFALDAGGGLALILKKRIILRFDFRNYTLFTPNSTDNRQEYSGGLEVFF